MGAIPIHHTAVTREPWDGPENEARLRNGADAAYYRKAYAWVDPDADQETKSAYKFIHHMVSANGEIGAANIRACQTGIAVLNGARGGADIPRADRRGVYEHLAAHLEDAEVEPPPLRWSRAAVERRAYSAEIEVRDVDGGMPKIVGHAAVFNRRSEVLLEWDGGRVVEEIAPGAFTKTLREADVRALINHDPNLVLGRNRAGTLRLYEDERGLAVEIDPPDTQAARDLIALMRRGDVTQMSFAFQPIKQEWFEEDAEDGIITHVRRLREVRLFDVSVVTFPAYPDTDATVRALIANAADELPEWLVVGGKPSQDDDHTPESGVPARLWHLRLEFAKLDLLVRE